MQERLPGSLEAEGRQFVFDVGYIVEIWCLHEKVKIIFSMDR